MIRILLVGPLPDPITGQSVAFSQVCRHLTLQNYVINTTRFSSKSLNTIYTCYKITRTFLAKNFDIVYFTCSRSNKGSVKDIYLIWLSSIFNKLVVNHLHGADFHDFILNSGSLRSLLIKSYNRVDASIVLLDKMADQFRLFPKMNTYTVPNSYSQELNVDHIVKDTPMVVLYLSNIMASKGIIEFLLSAELVLSENEDVKYVIAGAFMSDELETSQGIERRFNDILFRLQARFGKERIEYVGRVKGLKKVRLLVSSSIFVLPTYYKTEAFPISFLEAMRTGNAIISTKHNYIPEIIKPKVGLIVNKKSIIELVEAQKLLIANEELLADIQTNNVRLAKEDYSQLKYISRLEEVFMDLQKSLN